MLKYKILALPLTTQGGRKVRTLGWISGVIILFSFLFFWDPDKEGVFLMGWMDWSQLTVSYNRDRAFINLFYDLYSIWWALVLFFCIYSGLLQPLHFSFSVNQHLWVRLLPGVTPFDIALSKVYGIIYSLLMVLAVSVFWALSFSLMKGGNPAELLIPVLGLAGHILFSSGLILVASVISTGNFSRRKAQALLLMLLPVIFYLGGKNIASRLGGYFPYASPFANRYYEYLSVKPFLTACIAGIALMGIYLFKNYRITRKHQPS